MERNFKNGDFEKLLKENADQYRMYPSEKVWNGVYDALHTRRKWYGISALVLLLVLGVGSSIFILTNYSGNPVASAEKNVLSIAPFQRNSSPGEERKSYYENSWQTENEKSIPAVEIKTAIKAKFQDLPPKPGTRLLPDEIKVSENISQSQKTSFETDALLTNEKAETETAQINTVFDSPKKMNDNTRENNITEKIYTETDLIKAVNANASKNAPDFVSKKQKRFSTQLYFTPTVSYRKLSENKSPVINGFFTYAPVIDINNVVKHKPATGLEFGIEEKYRVTNRFFLKAGIQFNINRYDIRAYYHPTEIATVAINSGYRTDSVISLSNYRNFNGLKANWLEFLFLQTAVPVGIEIILSEGKNTKWGISGTIQPTYNIGDRAYLISSDYKNYAKFPDLIRRWNISSGIETFVSYSTGKIDWQAGPHVRYQHLSSFISGYPVKKIYLPLV